jgi:kynurenine formamidase
MATTRSRKTTARKARTKARVKISPAKAAAKKAPPRAKVAKASVRARTSPRTATRRVAAPPSPYRAPEPKLPKYDDLPVRAGAPKGSAWGVFGDDDQLGTINLMTPQAVREAAGSIRSGRVFSLNLAINIPDPPIFGRGKHAHTIKHLRVNVLDDYLDNFYPQASSQWDALCHVKHPALGAYNGIPDSEITGYGGTKLGIDNLARRGIAGRGVLADIARYHERIGKTIDFMSNDMIPLEDLERTLAAQKTQIRPGDVLLVRIGWTKAYLGLTPEQKQDLADHTRCPGLEGSRRTARWLWENHIAAAASDSPALEVMPPPGITDFGIASETLHFQMLSFFGMPIGEMWDLEALADDCARDRRYEFFFTSAPLNVPGGVGSPPNALAIK